MKSVTRAIWGLRSDGLLDLSGRGTVGCAVNADLCQVSDPLSVPGGVEHGLQRFRRSCREANLDSRTADAGEGLEGRNSVRASADTSCSAQR